MSENKRGIRRVFLKDKDDDKTSAKNIAIEERKNLLNRQATGPGKGMYTQGSKKKSSNVVISLPSGGGVNTVETCPEYFGVRSYLHNFYESVAVKNPQLYEDIYEEDLALAQSRKRRLKFFRICWRFSVALGAVLLVVGLIFILFGHLMPHRGVVVGLRGDMEIVDRDARKFNDFLNLCRIIGLGIFCGGGGIFCMALLFPVMINLQCDEEVSREPFQAIFAAEEPPRSPTDKKIPATEELTSVQPKRDVKEEVVMTNSGLCEVPVSTRVSVP